MGEIKGGGIKSIVALLVTALGVGAQEQQHRIKERDYWDRQIRVAKWLNGLTAAGALVALGGLGFLYWSIHNANRAIVEANRAWIGPLAGSLIGELSPQKPLSAVVRLYNSGKAPALDSQVRFHLRNVTGAQIDSGEATRLEEDDVCSSDEPDQHGRVIYPYISENGVDETIPLSNSSPENKNVYDQFIGGGWSLVIELCAAYRSFGETHKTAVCYYYRPMVSNAERLTICIGGQHAS